MVDSSDERTVMAQAMAWVSRITTISFEMVLPGLLGIWVDRKLGTKVLFTLLGAGGRSGSAAIFDGTSGALSDPRCCHCFCCAGSRWALCR